MILVTGASGYIGQNLVRRLASEEQPLRVILRTPNANFPPTVDRRILGEFCGSDLTAVMDGVRTVIHLAGRAHVFNDQNANPDSAYRVANTELTFTLGRAAAASGVRRFVFMSTVKIYGDDHVGPLSEADPPLPDDPYGRSKLEAEKVLQNLSQETNLSTTIVRAPLVYGPHCTGNVSRLCRLLGRRIPLPLGTVRNRRSMVSVKNLVDLLVCVARDERAANETFVVSDGPPISTPEMIESLCEGLAVKPYLLSTPPWLLFMAGNAFGFGAEVKRLCGSLEVDARKIAHLLAWAPLQTTHQGLIEAGASFRIEASPAR